MLFCNKKRASPDCSQCSQREWRFKDQNACLKTISAFQVKSQQNQEEVQELTAQIEDLKEQLEESLKNQEKYKKMLKKKSDQIDYLSTKFQEQAAKFALEKDRLICSMEDGLDNLRDTFISILKKEKKRVKDSYTKRAAKQEIYHKQCASSCNLKENQSSKTLSPCKPTEKGEPDHCVINSCFKILEKIIDCYKVPNTVETSETDLKDANIYQSSMLTPEKHQAKHLMNSKELEDFESSLAKFEAMEEALVQKDKLIHKLKKKKLKIDKKSKSRLKLETTVNFKVDQLIKDVKKSVTSLNQKNMMRPNSVQRGFKKVKIESNQALQISKQKGMERECSTPIFFQTFVGKRNSTLLSCQHSFGDTLCSPITTLNEKKSSKVIKMKMCRKKKPPVSTKTLNTTKNSPTRDHKIKTLTKDEFQLYRSTMDQSKSPGKVKCKLCHKKGRIKDMQTHVCFSDG
ncbi:unnamed protein product [Moneuplotes crassus]|uniref:Uncharacterized protein n=1 Tax=Euplotes crassus TaxID=5936 RepID=A0AAD1U9F4_EUPCR|nr:unnamed protein product [Moneuplotes crassus]